MEDKTHKIINLPNAVKFITIINILSFLIIEAIYALASNGVGDEFLYKLAFVPSRYSGGVFSFEAIYSIFTHMFMHGGWIHLCVNVLTLMAFGTPLEKIWGYKRFIAFYLVTGLLAVFTYTLFHISSDVPLVGASGAISGLFGGVLCFVNKDKIENNKRSFIFSVFIITLSLIAFGMLGLPGVDQEIAWEVHISGFLSGILLFFLFNKIKF